MVGSSFSPLSRFFHFEEAVDWFSDRFQEEIGNCLRLEISVQGEVRIYRTDRVVFLFFLMRKVTRKGFRPWDRSNCVRNEFVEGGGGDN